MPILIDQEGGRVARMAPPEWPDFPTAEAFDRLYDVAPMSAIEAARANAQAIAAMLAEVGINVDCLPLLDVRDPAGHDIIGDRAFGARADARRRARPRDARGTARAAASSAWSSISPAMAARWPTAMSSCPSSPPAPPSWRRDLAPFIALADAPMAMTAHVVYPAWDAGRCASLSPKVIGEIIRGRIGFDGLLMSDDLGMQALSGGFGERARGVLAAGCDVALHCSGDMAEMAAVAGAVGEIAHEAARAARPRDGERRGRQRDATPSPSSSRSAMRCWPMR